MHYFSICSIWFAPMAEVYFVDSIRLTYLALMSISKEGFGGSFQTFSWMLSGEPRALTFHREIMLSLLMNVLVNTKFRKKRTHNSCYLILIRMEFFYVT